jgi:hypothetical protein
MSQILSQGMVKIRKARKCWGCAREFPAGSDLDRITSTDQGKASSTYWCRICTEAFNRWMLHDDEVGYGDLRYNDPEAWERLRAEMEAGPGYSDRTDSV